LFVIIADASRENARSRERARAKREEKRKRGEKRRYKIKKNDLARFAFALYFGSVVSRNTASSECTFTQI